MSKSSRVSSIFLSYLGITTKLALSFSTTTPGITSLGQWHSWSDVPRRLDRKNRFKGSCTIMNMNASDSNRNKNGDTEHIQSKGSSSYNDEINNTSRRTTGNIRNRERFKQKPIAVRSANSYLKLVLDETTFDQMHDLSTILKKQIQKEFSNNETNERNDTTAVDSSQRTTTNEQELSRKHSRGGSTLSSQKSSNGIKARTIAFKPRSRQSLHVTFFFGGDVLCSLPTEELERWHQEVSSKLVSSTPISTTDLKYIGQKDDLGASQTESDSHFNNSTKASNTEEDTLHFLTFKKIALFPPHRKRKNLIVAILEPSSKLRKIHAAIHKIAKTSDSELLNRISQKNPKQWIAHVTLGNIVGSGGNDGEWERVESLVNQGNEVANRNEILKKWLEDVDKTCTVHGVTMGGPIPEQCSLNWSFGLS